jgi:hypothetical protein
MKQHHAWFLVILGVVVLSLGAVVIIAGHVLASPNIQTTDIPSSVHSVIRSNKAAVLGATTAVKPVNGWIVCQDLGIGPVPGLPGPRQRFVLCHPSGWQVRVYCLDTTKPPPPLGRSCTRISSDTYRCGNINQPLKEYQILVTPTHTPTPTATQTPTLTPTSTPTSTSTPVFTPTPVVVTPGRVRPGGGGNGGLVLRTVGAAVFSLLCAAISFLILTRWRHNHPTDT